MTAVCKEFLLGGSRPFTQPEMRMLSGSTHEDHSRPSTDAASGVAWVASQPAVAFMLQSLQRRAVKLDTFAVPICSAK